MKRSLVTLALSLLLILGGFAIGRVSAPTRHVILRSVDSGGNSVVWPWPGTQTPALVAAAKAYEAAIKTWQLSSKVDESRMGLHGNLLCMVSPGSWKMQEFLTFYHWPTLQSADLAQRLAYEIESDRVSGPSGLCGLIGSSWVTLQLLYAALGVNL